MRILFMGTPRFALESLRKLFKAGEEIVGVITQPDRPKGRGKKITAPPVKIFAQEEGIQTYQPEKLKDEAVLRRIADFCPDLVVVVAYGRILPRELLELPPEGCINLHASLLPKYRGAAPIHWALLQGEKVTGVTTMYMDEGLDTGDLILQRKVPIASTDTTGTLYDELAMVGSDLLLETLAQIKNGTAPRLPQPEEGVTYAPPIIRKDEGINWSQPAREIWFQVRALNPRPGAVSKWKGRNLKIWDVAPAVDKIIPGEAEPGQVCGIKKEKGIIVSTGEGALLLRKVQPAGKRIMSASDFARGYGVELGMTFGD